MAGDTIIFNTTPAWAQIKFCVHHTGVPYLTIKRLFNDGKIRARKERPDDPRSATVYRVSGICDWLDNDCPSPHAFKLPEAANG